MRVLFLLLFFPLALPAQQKAGAAGGGAGAASRDTSTIILDWDNYATCYTGSGVEGSVPVMMTALPFNGRYTNEIDHIPNPAVDLPIPVSNGPRPQNYRRLNTYDSSDVYFFVQNIHPANADQFEYRVLLNGRISLTGWQPITRFGPKELSYNSFKDRFAILGGFHTTWNNYLLADVRSKKTGSIVTCAVVYWTAAKPSLLNIYTNADLNTFFKKNKRPWDQHVDDSELVKWRQRYAPDQIDPANHLPRHLVLSPAENSLLLYLHAGIYSRNALEYQLIRNDRVFSAWKTNDDIDNSYIWLKNLPSGEYVIQMRFSAQRHEVAAYPFTIRTAWQQSWPFLTALWLLGALLVFALSRLLIQHRRARLTQANKQRLQLELKSIRSQLNPHFIFNALSSIQGLINKNDIDAANRYLSEFGQLLRESLSASDNDFVELSRELLLLNRYLQLEQLRFGFQYQIEVAPDLSAGDTMIPALLLQPLIENAVKHGISALSENGRIVLRFFKENATFIAQVIDNGSGWDPGAATKGYGIRLTEEKILLLNGLMRGQMRHSSIEMQIRTEPSTVTLLFKNWWE